jgi:hypothetical protein
MKFSSVCKVYAYKNVILFSAVVGCQTLYFNDIGRLVHILQHTINPN